MDRERSLAAARSRGIPVDRLLIIGQLVLVTAIWGGGFIAAKVAAGGVPPITAAALRTLIASLIFVPVIWAIPRNRPKFTRRDWLAFGLLSLLGYSLMNILYFSAFTLTTVTQASLIWGAVPLVTAVLAAVTIREALTLGIILGVVATTVGVAAVVIGGAPATHDSANPLLGNLIIGACLVMWVLYSIVAKVVMRRYSALTVTGTACTLGAITLVPIALLTDWRPEMVTETPVRAWIALLYSGGISLVISYVLWIDGVRKIGATRVAIFTNLSPIWAVVFAAWWLGEVISPLHLIGGALILLGVWLANRKSLARDPSTQ